MNDANFLQGIFTPEMIQITHWGFIFNLILTGLLSYILGKILYSIWYVFIQQKRLC